jgi:hypothetical protein
MFDRAADESISDGKDRDCHYQANGSPDPPFPEEQHPHDDQQPKKVTIAAQERHGGIEDRIRQPEVSDAKQVDVECLEPMHPYKV